MTIDRHPESLRNLIRDKVVEKDWEFYEVSYDSIDALITVPLEEIDAVLLAPARHFPVEFMERLIHCKLMQIWSSGFDKFNIHDAHRLGLPVANNHGSNAISVAEHTILMMLGASRRAPEMHNRVVTGNWAGNDHGVSSFSVFGKTLGIVGLGNIGTLVAHRAEAFGMKVIFHDPGLESSPSLTWMKQTFEELLELSDYLSFHVHLDDTTRHMLNLHNLSRLTRRPFLINVSRAEIIEKNALLEALRSETIRGLAMDAHFEEPTRPDDDLMAQGNVFFTPHVAGSTWDSYCETVDACLSNIGQAVSGNAIAGIISASA